MMHVYVVQNQDGRIVSVNRTSDGVAHFANAHGVGARVAGDALSIDGVDRALADGAGRTSVEYDDVPPLRVEYHVLTV